VPTEVGWAAKYNEPSVGSTLDIVSHGKIFRITKNAEGTWGFNGIIDADFSANPGLVLLLVLVSVTALILMCVAAAGWGEADKQRGAKSEAEQKLQDLQNSMKEREAEIQDRERGVTKASRDLERQVAAIDSQKEELEQQERILMAAQRVVQLTRTAPTRDEWQKLGERVRAEVFKGGAQSRDLAVQYFLDPETTGAVVFEWEMLCQRPQAPTLLVLRDNVECRRETGCFKGRFASVMLQKRKRYKYIFKIMDGERAYPNPLLIELLVPPFQAWTSPTETKKQRTKEDWINENIEWFKKMGQWPADQQAQKEMLSKLDAEAIRHFGEA